MGEESPPFLPTLLLHLFIADPTYQTFPVTIVAGGTAPSKPLAVDI